MSQTLTVNDIKNHFDQVVISAQESPITITRKGKPVLMVLSMQEFAMFESIKQEYINAQLKEGVKGVTLDDMLEGDVLFERLLKGY